MLRSTISTTRTSLSPLAASAGLHWRTHTVRSRTAAWSHFSRLAYTGLARGVATSRTLRTEASAAATATSTIPNAAQGSTATTQERTYNGPLAPTFRRLKIFSLSSLGLSTTLAPFMFLVESNLPFSARLALAGIAIGTSGISTGLVGWCGKPYVTNLKYLKPDSDDTHGLELTTLTLTLQPRITRVYDECFLVETKRPFAKWELAEKLVLPPSRTAAPGQEETVAETFDKNNTVLGRWVVTWGEGGEGKCREVGSVIRHFNVHEELLN
ncbi:hypothetical protein AX16_006223 [Volvariella volvacea WC 439]|nr:hypothetical protein AX16_006223 [Volvariella volvacea WC 439]